jgi:hypothetical protein
VRERERERQKAVEFNTNAIYRILRVEIVCVVRTCSVEGTMDL